MERKSILARVARTLPSHWKRCLAAAVGVLLVAVFQKGLGAEPDRRRLGRTDHLVPAGGMLFGLSTDYTSSSSAESGRSTTRGTAPARA